MEGQHSFNSLIGSALTGLGFSLVFPSFGVLAIKRLPSHQKGIALGAYVAFFDLALGVTAPVAGIIAGWFGYAAIYCFGAIASVISALLALSLKRMVLSQTTNATIPPPISS
jgi:MFS family permease